VEKIKKEDMMLIDTLSSLFDRVAILVLYLLGGKGTAKEYKELFKED